MIFRNTNIISILEKSSSGIRSSLKPFKKSGKIIHSSLTIFVVFRYNILAAAAVANAKNDKAAAKSLFEIVGLEAEKYRLGHTKASNDLQLPCRCIVTLVFCRTSFD